MSAPPVESANPRAVDDLLPQARTLMASLGEVPARNRLMAELRIGAPKATYLRGLLVDEQTRDSDSGPGGSEPDLPEPAGSEPDPAGSAEQAPAGHPDLPPPARRPAVWPVLLLALPAFVSIWSGWVELGRLTGFGVVHPLPGIADQVQLDTAITLPIGVETYAAYALWVWLSGRAPARARRFARVSAIGSLIFGACGQIAYHLMAAAGVTAAPWQITTAVSCLPVAVLGMGAALAHLVRSEDA